MWSSTWFSGRAMEAAERGWYPTLASICRPVHRRRVSSSVKKAPSRLAPAVSSSARRIGSAAAPVAAENRTPRAASFSNAGMKAISGKVSTQLLAKAGVNCSTRHRSGTAAPRRHVAEPVVRQIGTGHDQVAWRERADMVADERPILGGRDQVDFVFGMEMPPYGAEWVAMRPHLEGLA